jgi:predicted DCC family thiol-disulfide oxidoreductase YuxK
VILLPRASRNRFYSFVAQNRYSMFGKYEACPAAGDPAIKARLID